jgi:hypothetical protein
MCRCGLMNKEQNVAVCDATKFNRNTKAGNIKKEKNE